MSIEWPTLRRVLAVTLGLPERRIGETAKCGDFTEWDSLGHMLLMLEIEKVFEIRLTADDFKRLISADLILERLNEDPRSAP